MNVSNCPRFLSECIIQDPERQAGLLDDEMYGVYLSWCFLNREDPASENAFWAALNHMGHAKRSGTKRLPGLAMTGPAAVDYILYSQPSLV